MEKNQKPKISLRECGTLYWVFFRIGAVLFGGGYAILPYLQREFVEKREWVTMEEIADYFAVGQCTPGIIAVNTATFIGYKRQRVPGGILSTLGVITPSLIIITLLAALLSNFMEIEIVRHAFAGIRIAVAALIVNAVIKFIKAGVKDFFGIAIYAAALLLGLLLDISPVFTVIAAAAVGLIFKRKAAAK